KFRKLPEMRVAGSQFRPGIANPDDRASLEQILRPSLVLHPTAVEKAVLVLTPKPCLAAKCLHGELSQSGSDHSANLGKRNLEKLSNKFWGTRPAEEWATPIFTNLGQEA